MTTLRRSERLASMPRIHYGPTKKNTVPWRMLRELAEFDDPVYKTEFTNVIHDSVSSVIVKHLNGKRYKITRSNNFLEEPPVVVDVTSGERVGPEYGFDSWYPCLTAVRWFMMLLAE